jgi:xylan 1,4-beta-xylosidase
MMPTITIGAQDVLGPLELSRHGVGHGGINSLPLPDRVVQGTAALKPQLIRIFIQEFFNIYPDHGRFDWSKLDPYMDALARTGAKVIAAITIKPGPLYPEIDQARWRPTDVGEWQAVIRALVRRYSVEREIVTHWEIGNECDIGEDGGSPYLIRDPEDYAAYYQMTASAILEAFPGARVGGPANAGMHNEPLPGLLRRHASGELPLDFLSWHLYHSDPGRHGYQTQIARLLAREQLGAERSLPELMVTEWNCDFAPVSVEDEAFDPRRAALTAAAILEMRRAGLDWSFYYHLWDQICYPEEFGRFFSEKGARYMARYWNDIPIRFGLFGVNGDVRPQYFVFRMLAELGEEEVQSHSDTRGLRALAGRSGDQLSVFVVNHDLDFNSDQVVRLLFRGLKPGPRRLTVTRIDRQRHWDADKLVLLPVEQRDTYVAGEYECQILLPANGVAHVTLA